MEPPLTARTKPWAPTAESQASSFQYERGTAERTFLSSLGHRGPVQWPQCGCMGCSRGRHTALGVTTTCPGDRH